MPAKYNFFSKKKITAKIESLEVIGIYQTKSDIFGSFKFDKV